MTKTMQQKLRDAAADWDETQAGRRAAAAVLARLDRESELLALAEMWTEEDALAAYGFTVLDILAGH